jgi:hypothetical protein
MNDVRDEAVGALLDRAALAIDAQPADRLPEVLRRGTRRRAVRFTAIGAAIAVFVGTVSWAGLTLRTSREAIPGDVTEWRTFGSLEEDGWTVQVPPSWKVQEFCASRLASLDLGAIVTNVEFEFKDRDGTALHCGDETFEWAGFPRGGVAFAFQPYAPVSLARRVPLTPFPLTPEMLSETGGVGGAPSESYVLVRLPGESYPVAHVRRWVGSEASPEDVAALDELLGSLQVRGASRWVETEGEMSTLYDNRRDFTVTYPSSWTVAGENLTPWLVSPGEILSLGTYPLRVSEHPDDGFRLFDAPVAPAALEDMTSVDAFISLQESGERVALFDARPDHFGPLGCEEAIYGCHPEEDPDLPEPWRDPAFRAWWIPFEDAGRGFYLFVAIGNEATLELRAQVWQAADSLSFEPAS